METSAGENVLVISGDDVVKLLVLTRLRAQMQGQRKAFGDLRSHIAGELEKLEAELARKPKNEALVMGHIMVYRSIASILERGTEAASDAIVDLNEIYSEFSRSDQVRGLLRELGRAEAQLAQASSEASR